MKYLIALIITIMLFCGCTKHYHNALCNNSEYYEKWESKCDEHSTKELNSFGEGALLLLAIGASMNQDDPIGNSRYINRYGILGPVTPDAYGLGGGTDATGRPVTLQPAFSSGSSFGSEVQTPNAYGPGINSDQYGRPVIWVPR
jgi:hypothetical protein